MRTQQELTNQFLYICRNSLLMGYYKHSINDNYILRFFKTYNNESINIEIINKISNFKIFTLMLIDDRCYTKEYLPTKTRSHIGPDRFISHLISIFDNPKELNMWFDELVIQFI